jgi:hypothetical protein
MNSNIKTYTNDWELGNDSANLFIKSVLGELDLSHVDCLSALVVRVDCVTYNS